MLGQMVNVTACSRCNGEGRIVDKPCPTCRGRGPIAAPQEAAGHRSRPASTRVTRSVSRARARPGRAADRRATSTWPFTSRRTRSSAATGPRSSTTCSLSIAQAALGTRVRIPTIEGDEDLEIRPGTQPGTEIRLRGRGVPHLRRPGTRGDLHVLVRVNVPTKLSKKQRQLLEELAAESGEPVLPGGIFDRVKDALG